MADYMFPKVRTAASMALLWLVFVFSGGADRVAAAETSYEHGLLFQIQRSGELPSYLFGTIHSENPRVKELPDLVRNAFEQSTQFVMEVIPDPAALLRAMAAMTLTEGRTLEDVLGAKLYLDTLAAAKLRGIPETLVRSYKPWAVATLLSVPVPKTGLFLDMDLYLQAIEQAKVVTGLETSAEQLAIFDGLTESEQVALLRDTLKTLEHMPLIYQEVLESYLRRDLAALVRLNEGLKLSDPKLAARLQVRAVDDRNRRMVERLVTMLAAGKTFIAVGALHLPGSKGILRLLEDQGFQVNRVY